MRQRRATGSRPEGGNLTDETLVFLPLLVVSRERAASPSAQILDLTCAIPTTPIIQDRSAGTRATVNCR